MSAVLSYITGCHDYAWKSEPTLIRLSSLQRNYFWGKVLQLWAGWKPNKGTPFPYLH